MKSLERSDLKNPAPVIRQYHLCNRKSTSNRNRLFIMRRSLHLGLEKYRKTTLPITYTSSIFLTYVKINYIQLIISILFVYLFLITLI
ncbi:MAG: hypothetical protein ACI86L_000786 [Dokdonia sp.]|jgi:hypothetical protein